MIQKCIESRDLGPSSKFARFQPLELHDAKITALVGSSMHLRRFKPRSVKPGNQINLLLIITSYIRDSS